MHMQRLMEKKISKTNPMLSMTQQYQNNNSQMTLNFFNNLGEVLTYWAEVQPKHKAYTMLNSKGVENSHITYAQMHYKAINIAEALLSYGIQSRNVILLYPPGNEFIVTFFG